MKPEVPFEFQDAQINKEGRYGLIRGRLIGKRLMIGSIYAPNTNQIHFLQTLSPLMSQDEPMPMILGGDFNLVGEGELG